ncbi:MAG: tRNA preQ1(34) S-adenosylmethionine ribosyltransferase-isomerase QueA [Anaerolineae bacterium]|jgi:S-adenosylmethionine:tRNA ribosyltransferase-isomerase|nr:tRNA preQ1(34) S-adenosylmethionine ribosyltransferase-isomerase QueA [Anaerolineae bacterium]
MKIDELDYTLPEGLIAQEAVEPRDTSRLLVIHRDTNSLEHRIFKEIEGYLQPGDLLVANESRVIPARLFGQKTPTGGKVEVLLLRPLDDTHWRCLIGGARTRVGSRICLTKGDVPTDIEAQITETGERGERTLAFQMPLESRLDEIGVIPLPPYIHRPIENPERYQTIYSRTPGSAAAPTAGLHFTPELMLALRDRGIRFAFVTLHVGLDTFRPIDEEVVENHRIHREWIRLTPDVAEQINQTKLAGGRIIAVGTTTMRVLETAAHHGLLQSPDGACPWRTVAPYEGFTDIYITPGFQFRAVDALITNFHLPKSTLLALVMAYAGKELIRRAYQEAIQEQYRFFSLGDACLIL